MQVRLEFYWQLPRRGFSVTIYKNDIINYKHALLPLTERFSVRASTKQYESLSQYNQQNELSILSMNNSSMAGESNHTLTAAQSTLLQKKTSVVYTPQ
jgi:hypothetical protein